MSAAAAFAIAAIAALSGCGSPAIARYIPVEGKRIAVARAMVLERPGQVLVGFRESQAGDATPPHVDRVRLADGQVLGTIGPLDASVLRIRMLADGRALVLTEKSLSWIVGDRLVARCTLAVEISDVLPIDTQLLATGAGLFAITEDNGTCTVRPLPVPVEPTWRFHGLLQRGTRVLAISNEAFKLVEFEPGSAERPRVISAFERIVPLTPIMADAAVLADGRLVVAGGPGAYVRVLSLERDALDLDLSVGPRPRAPVLDGATCYVLTDRGIAELRRQLP